MTESHDGDARSGGTSVPVVDLTTLHHDLHGRATQMREQAAHLTALATDLTAHARLLRAHAHHTENTADILYGKTP